MAAKKRSSRLIAIGVVVFVVGIGLALVALRAVGFDVSSMSGASDNQARSFEDATEDSPEQESEEPAAPEEEQPEDGAAAGEVNVKLNPRQRVPQNLDIPNGREAVALQLKFDQAVASLPGPGDRVNLYAVFTKNGSGGAGEPGGATGSGPFAKLVLEDVEVLAVAGPNVDAGAGTPTLVLALTQQETEQAILLHTAETVWLSLRPPDATTSATSGATSGADNGSVLQ